MTLGISETIRRGASEGIGVEKAIEFKEIAAGSTAKVRTAAGETGDLPHAERKKTAEKTARNRFLEGRFLIAQKLAGIFRLTSGD